MGAKIDYRHTLTVKTTHSNKVKLKDKGYGSNSKDNKQEGKKKQNKIIHNNAHLVYIYKICF